MHARTLDMLLTHGALRFPENQAVVYRERAITYSELDRMSNQLARFLAGYGVMPGDRVAIVLHKSIESIVSLFGILKAGGIYVPVDPAAPVTRMEQIIRSCGIQCAITSARIWTAGLSLIGPNSPLRLALLTETDRDACGAAAGGREVAPWEEIFREEPGPPERTGSSDDSPAYILHTSGSTGVPKGVVISHRNALAFVEMASAFFCLSGSDRVGSHAPLHFDLSVFDIFTAIHTGAAIVLVPEFLSTFPLRLAEYIDREGLSIWNSVSSVLVMLADGGRLERFGFPALRLVHFSGDVMPAKYLRILKQHMTNAAFYNIYGQTEANSSLCYPVRGLEADDSRKIPIGKPFPGFEVYALDEHGRVAAGPGDEGELYVSGPTVARGYWNDAVRTAERFVPDPRQDGTGAIVYRTGDLARIDADGNYVFSGRKDHMVKSRGYRIELDEIELAITSHPAVHQAAVVALPDDVIGNRIIAYVSLTPGSVRDAGALADFCAARLPKYMVPEAFLFLESLPATSTGKIDRKALAAARAGAEAPPGRSAEAAVTGELR